MAKPRHRLMMTLDFDKEIDHEQLSISLTRFLSTVKGELTRSTVEDLKEGDGPIDLLHRKV